MSLWVSLDKIERKPFLTLPDRLVANYHVIKEHVLQELGGVTELAEFPSIGEMRRYIEKNPEESKDAYYDRALQLLPELKAYVLKYQPVAMVLGDERDYLENHRNYEELFFLKRCYELADDLKEAFADKFATSDDMAIVLTADELSDFNKLTEQDVEYDEKYIYKLFVG